MPHLVEVSIHHLQVLYLLIDQADPVSFLREDPEMVVFRGVLALLLLPLHLDVNSLLVACHLKSLLGGVLVVASGGAVETGSELGVDLLHLVFHLVLLARMNGIHDLDGVLLVSHVDLSPLSCLSSSFGHLLVYPVGLHFLPLFIKLVALRHKFVVVSQLCL